MFGEIGNDNDLHQISSTANGGLTGTSSAYRTSVSEVGFTNSKSAGLVAEAISTLLLLRAQEGVTSNQKGYIHWLCDRGLNAMFLTVYTISPQFETKELADAATKVVGEDRIIRMFKILNGEAV